MSFTNEQMTKAKSAKTAEELLATAKENGIEMTADEAAKYFAEFHKQGELADEELDNVYGGCVLDPTPLELERSDVNGCPTVRSTEVRPCGWDGNTMCGDCEYFKYCVTDFKDHDGICTLTGWF